MNDEQLTQRMRAAADDISLSDAAQARHLEAISAALTRNDVVPLSVARKARRRRIVASVVAAAVIAPTGLAAASEDSLPGDALYPVKQISERVRVLFDSEVIARHRIEEIEALEDAGRTDSELYQDAREALTELGADHPLWQRLAASTPDRETVEDDDGRSDGDSTKPATLTLALPDGGEAVFTLGDGRLRDVEAPAGWSVTELEDDEVTLEHADFTVHVEVLPDGSLRSRVTERLDDDSASDDSDDDDSESDDPDSGQTSVSDDDSSEFPSTTSTSAPDDGREDDSESDDDDAGSSDDDTSEGERP